MTVGVMAVVAIAAVLYGLDKSLAPGAGILAVATLTAAEWRALLELEGFEVLWHGVEPMALLKMRRNIADEGVGGVLRIMRNVLTHPDLRARVIEMRRVFNTYGDALTGIAFVVRRKD